MNKNNDILTAKLDDAYKLSIKINNNNPVELNRLTTSLNALSQQYNDFLLRHNYEETEGKLYVDHIENGCISLELITDIVSPFLANINIIVEFLEYLKVGYDYLLGKKALSDLPRTFSKKEIKNFYNSLEQVAKDNGSNINFNIKGNNNQVIFIDSVNANAMQNKAVQDIKNMQEEETTNYPETYNKVTFRWLQLKGSPESVSADKGVIEKISKNGVKVIFTDESLKQRMLNEAYPFKTIYLIDVQVHYSEDKAVFYEISKLYDTTLDEDSLL